VRLGLEDARERVGFLLETVDKPARRLHERIRSREQGETGRRRVDVVGGLAEVHMIVRMDAGVRAPRLAQDFGRAVRDDLVGVHVVGRAGSSLVYVDDKLIAQSAREDFVSRRDDRASNARVKPSEGCIGFGSRLFDEDCGRHKVGLVARAVWTP
jgi:hypothetical protein